MVGDDSVIMHTQGCEYHGSSYEIQAEWDPGPIYVVQRLWDPGGPIYTSILGNLKQYLDLSQCLELISNLFLVILVLHLVSKLHLAKLDHMGSFRYTPILAIALDRYLDTAIIPRAVN